MMANLETVGLFASVVAVMNSPFYVLVLRNTIHRRLATQ